MDLVVVLDGTVRALYAEDIDLDVFGQTVITWASHVEPDANGRWIADLTPDSGPVLGLFDRRSQALEADLAWLEANWFTKPT
jgi:hypothetical protein